MKLAKRLVATAAAAAACIAAGVTATHADETPAGGDQPPYAIEDFAYPDATRILAERGITLKRGDGNITLADCAPNSGLMEVYSRTKGTVCFRVSGKTGYLSLEIPAVYGMKGDAAHRTEVTLTAEGSEQNISVAPNEWKGVGESADPQRRDHVLVEISASE
ncbi:hypothetical protein [Streptomyces globosus]|uniref:hypothetical protein n=1 Tax=Streptomyces globosus TaxID=68209 RepID=UPI0031D3E6C3